MKVATKHFQNSLISSVSPLGPSACTNLWWCRLADVFANVFDGPDKDWLSSRTWLCQPRMWLVQIMVALGSLLVIDFLPRVGHYTQSEIFYNGTFTYYVSCRGWGSIIWQILTQIFGGRLGNSKNKIMLFWIVMKIWIRTWSSVLERVFFHYRDPFFSFYNEIFRYEGNIRNLGQTIYTHNLPFIRRGCRYGLRRL